jgi:ABC-type transporter Mla subunit MlaD
MKEIENVWKQLSELNLAIQKVDLSIVSELNKFIKTSITVVKNTNKITDAAKSSQKRLKEAEDVVSDKSGIRKFIKEDIVRSIKYRRGVQDDISRGIQKVEQAAKELGANPSDIFENYKIALASIKTLDRDIDELNKALKLVR